MTRPADLRATFVAILLAAIVAACSASPTSPGPVSSGPTSIGPSPSPSAAAIGSSGVGPSAAPTATGSRGPSPKPESVGDARRADLAYLVKELERIHPNPFLDEGEAAFMARLDAIASQADEMTDVGFLVAVMRLMGARDRDGHSGAWAMAQPSTLLHGWPIWLWWFPDGIRVVAAQPSLDRLIGASLLGARLIRVGHASVDDAIAAVRPLVPRDNASNERANLPIYLTLPEVATELGLLEDGDPALTFELADGTTRQVDPEPQPIDAVRDWIFGEYGGDYPEALPPDADGPTWLRPTTDAFWTETLADPTALYVGYLAVDSVGADGMTIGHLADVVRATAGTDPARPIVVDLRRNGGGNNRTYPAFLDTLRDVATAHPGTVRVLAGPSTFSAAGNFITELKVGRGGDAVRLVGESPGGGLDMYGDVGVVTLPTSGIVVLISSRYHEKAPGDDRLQIEPDIPVDLTWADYAAGRDPVLEAALSD